MNKKQVVASLNEIANELDILGHIKEANVITDLMIKLSQSNAPGEQGKAYRTEANLTTPPTADYIKLINHFKELSKKRDPASDIEMQAIWNKVQRNGYNFPPIENNALQRQIQRIMDNRNQKVDVDEIMYQIFKKLMPEGVTIEGINKWETEITDKANAAGVRRVDRYLQKTREMLSTKQRRWTQTPTGRSEELRGYGQHDRPETGYYGFGK